MKTKKITMPLIYEKSKKPFTKKTILLQFKIRTWKQANDFIETVEQVNRKFKVENFWCSPYLSENKAIPIRPKLSKLI